MAGGGWRGSGEVRVAAAQEYVCACMATRVKGCGRVIRQSLMCGWEGVEVKPERFELHNACPARTQEAG